MPQIGPLEIVMILVVALIVFGPKKLPEVGKQAARGFREFRRFQTGLRSDLQQMLDEDDENDEQDVTPPAAQERTALDRADDDIVDVASGDAPSADAPTTTETSGAAPESDVPPADTTQ
jgi:sec-independent protein translocase protein TatA